jgi:hypothetical protein
MAGEPSLGKTRRRLLPEELPRKKKKKLKRKGLSIGGY